MTGAVAISIPVVAAATARPFEPRDVATLNDSIVRLAVIDGETPWHHHRDDLRQIADAHGGRATAENAPDGGAVVRLELPGETPADLQADLARRPRCRPR